MAKRIEYVTVSAAILDDFNRVVADMLQRIVNKQGCKVVCVVPVHAKTGTRMLASFHWQATIFWEVEE